MGSWGIRRIFDKKSMMGVRFYTGEIRQAEYAECVVCHWRGAGFRRISYLCLLVFLGCAGSQINQEEASVYVSRVIDGDSVEFRQPIGIDGLGEGRRQLRYIGVDTPEHGEPYWRAAKALNNRLVYGKRVKIELDRGMFDRYGRLLAYVYVGDMFINAELVRRGYAIECTIAPNSRYSTLFQRLEKEAREKRLGIWGERN